METKPKQEVKKTVWLWTVIGLLAGGWIGSLLGIVGSVIGGAIVGFLAYRSSAKTGGSAPAWLWQSRLKK
jgi:cobalamin synthase